MKRLYILFISIVICTATSHSQLLDILRNIKIRPGFVILNTGDTLLGSFEFNDCKENYRLVIYRDPVTYNSQAFEPQEVKLLSISENYYRPIEYKHEWVLMRVIFEDKLKFFHHKRFFTTFSNTGYSNEYYIIKPDGETLMVSTDVFYPFKTKAGYFFKDCPSVYEKIKNNTYSVKELPEIITEYNEWLKANK